MKKSAARLEKARAARGEGILRATLEELAMVATRAGRTEHAQRLAVVCEAAEPAGMSKRPCTPANRNVSTFGFETF